ncbi:hypothetical protein PV419_27180 [Streptomyces sp. ME19-01-6]|nr:hypothetical protein [Streptomyces sp. ME19-01-6]MDX3229248.1 hypothetical protein [Streptomyces sp. ME19-01-6]
MPAFVAPDWMGVVSVVEQAVSTRAAVATAAASAGMRKRMVMGEVQNA